MESNRRYRWLLDHVYVGSHIVVPGRIVRWLYRKAFA